jgi:UDP-4-amino-4,6-dideoxy-N-acetyl-beta-L-altrosamine transaminase
MKPIPYGRQNISQKDVDAVIEVLHSDYLTQGPKIEEFEKVFAEYIGAKYAVAVTNGTSALHLCTLALGVRPGDKVITTPITFVASANCVRYAGGDVVFADIDPETYLLDINKVEKMLKEAPKRTYSGIIPVDFSGRAVDLEAYRKIADAYGCWIIEDACHAPGGYFIDSNRAKQNCGNGNFAELGIFSFHPVKHIATGEGGMVTTSSEELYTKLRLFRSHGITKEPDSFQTPTAIVLGNQSRTNNSKSETYPGWYYEMQELGYNYRLTEIQAALGVSQLQKAKEGLARRREIAEIYNEAFKKKPYMKGQSGKVDGHGYHLYIIEVEDRNGLYTHLHKHSIFSQVHYIPVHLMPYYKQFGWNVGDMPQAEKYYNNCLSIPMYPSLTHKEQLFVIKKIEEYYE